jgi:hypothetical protein
MLNNLKTTGNRTEFIVSSIKEANHHDNSIVQSFQTRIESIEKGHTKLDKEVNKIIHVNQMITSFQNFQTTEIRKAHTLGVKLEREVEAYHAKYNQLIEKTHQHQLHIHSNGIKVKQMEPKLKEMSRVFQKLQNDLVGSEHLLRTLSLFWNNEAVKNNVRMARHKKQIDIIRKYMRHIKKIGNDNLDIGSTLAYAFTTKLEKLILEHKSLSTKVDSLDRMYENASFTSESTVK